MILTEYGLHFGKDGDRWRCVEYPDLLMLSVLDVLAKIGDDPRARFEFFKRLLAVAKEVARERGQ